MSEPTLADDEQTLRTYSAALLEAVESVAGRWIRDSIARFDGELARSAAADEAVSVGARTLVAEVGDLLRSDIDDQSMGPLQVLHGGVRFATNVLTAASIPPVARDAFAERAFPGDVYGLSPATFADVDAALHEPGLVWGAAKAHVHLRRRREARSLRVVALSVDLMDRSKISAGFPEAVLVRSPAQLVEAGADAGLVLVDLARVEDLSTLARLSGRVVGFASHVDEEKLAAAAAVGVEAFPRSVFFRRLASGEL